jgi:hypothetical protein
MWERKWVFTQKKWIPNNIGMYFFEEQNNPLKQWKITIYNTTSKKFQKMMIVLTCMLKHEVACFTRIRAHVRDFFENVYKTPQKQQRKNNLK